MASLSLLARFKLWLAVVLGTHYAAVVSLVDRALTAFLIVFGTKLIGGSAFKLHDLTIWSYWQTAAAAAIAAALSVVKSSLLVKTTGSPALLSLVSSTLRSRRTAGRRVQHVVPVRQRKAAA